jgi:hypothetical protein
MYGGRVFPYDRFQGISSSLKVAGLAESCLDTWRVGAVRVQILSEDAVKAAFSSNARAFWPGLARFKALTMAGLLYPQFGTNHVQGNILSSERVMQGS